MKNLVEQFLIETSDNHAEAVKHVHDAVNGHDIRDFHSHEAKKTGAAGASKKSMEKAHTSHLTAGFSHKVNKTGDVHVYKKGNTTITHYHGDGDINVHTKK